MTIYEFICSEEFRNCAERLRQSSSLRDAIDDASGMSREDCERVVRNQAIADGGCTSFAAGERIAAAVTTYRAPAARKEAATRELLPGLATLADASGISVSLALSLARAYASCAAWPREESRKGWTR